MLEGARIAGASVVAALLLVGSACDGSGSTKAVRQGEALAIANPSGSSFRHRPGQESIVSIARVRNRSEEPIVLETIELVDQSGIPEHGRVLDVMVGLDPRISGWSLTRPPVARFGGRCVEQELRAVKGTRVASGEVVLIAIWVRATSSGRFGARGERIVYRQGGRLFAQTEPFEFEAIVTERHEPSLTVDERRCKAEVRLLPQGRDRRG